MATDTGAVLSLAAAAVCLVAAVAVFADPTVYALRTPGFLDGDSPEHVKQAERLIARLGGLLLVLVGGFFAYLGLLGLLVT